MKQISEYVFMDDFLQEIQIENTLLPNPYYDYPFLVVDDFFTPSECDGYLEFVKESDDFKRAKLRVVDDGFIKEDIDKSIRDTTIYKLNEPLENIFLARFEQHKSKIEEFFHSVILSSTNIQVLGYDKGCFYKSHADDSSFLVDKNENIVGFKLVAPSRKLTTIVFVNDDFIGGEVNFSFLKDKDGKTVTFRPKKGSLLSFFSNPIFSHEVKKVTSGFRVTLVRWHDLIT